jgi:hypothetical protein
MSEVNKLANALALEAAKEVLVSSTLTVESDGIEWRDIDTEDLDGPLGSALKDELRYLKLREAIVWHATKPNLFRIVEVTA